MHLRRPASLVSTFSSRFIIIRSFSSNSLALYGIPKKNKLPPRPLWYVKEDEIEEVFLKGGRGPGGQKINKTNSKVQLTHKPTGIVVTCQQSRSQEQNRKKAREILALKLDDLYNPETSRNSVVNERKTKVKQSKAKKSHRKYKELDVQKELSKLQEHAESPSITADVEAEFDNFVSSCTLRGKSGT